MKLWQMLSLIPNWDDDDPDPDVTSYLSNHSPDVLTRLEESLGVGQTGDLLAGFGMLASLIQLYGVPSDLAALFPAPVPVDPQ